MASKPKAPKPDPAAPAKPFDPFDNPAAALLVSPLPPHHNLVLNKFAVVPEHFILATAAYKPQDHLLEAADLAAAYACIEAYAEAGNGSSSGGGGGGDGELFAFFNSGPHSGASQPHRHVQLLPVERMRDGLRAGEGVADGALGDVRWDVLADGLWDDEGGGVRKGFPFAVFAARIGRDVDARGLREMYLELYRSACRAAGEEQKEEEEGGENVGEARISYNLAMTRRVMVLCPRTAEGSVVRGPDGEVAGRLSLNGTLLGGTALVKSEAEWDALRKDPRQLFAVLEKIGVASGETDHRTASENANLEGGVRAGKI